MAYYKFNPKAQEKEAPGARSSFISSIVPEDNRWNPGEGKYTIRILPPWSVDGLIAKKIQVYYKAGRDAITFVSPEFFEQDTCPFVHAYKQIRNKISGDKGGYDRHKDDISLCRPVNRWYANVVVMDEVSKGCQLWGFGSKAYEQIMNLVDTGEYGDISDPENGTNLLLTLSPGTYGLTPIVHAVRNDSPLANMDWLDQMYDLDNIWEQPDIEDVKKAYVTTQFKVWTPDYLYEEPDDVPTHDTKSSTAVDDQYEEDPNRTEPLLEEGVDMATEVPTVDKVTGAPLDTMPDPVLPPSSTPAGSAAAFGAALDLAEKIKARTAANKE